MIKIRENGATSGVGVLAQYGYDQLGFINQITRGNGSVTTLTKDLGRIRSLFHNMGSASHNLQKDLTYNASGQMRSAASNNSAYAFTAITGSRAYTSNGLNQYTTVGPRTYGYDARGNLTSDGVINFQYDAENRMMATWPNPSVQLRYDPLGRLSVVTGSAGTTRFAYQGNQILAELNGTGGLLNRYVYGPGYDTPIVWYSGAGTSLRKFLHADERGSIVAISDSSGNVVNKNSYDEFGIPGTSNQGRFQYTGQAWIPEIGLYYYKARMYSPTLGRFMQTDPIGYADGLNWYNYVASDPINKIDPSGLGYACDDDICVDGKPGETDPWPNWPLRFDLWDYVDSGGGRATPKPAQSATKPSYCGNMLYKLGESVDEIAGHGKTVAATGVAMGAAAAVVGGIATAPAGGEGALPGLGLMGVSAKGYAIASYVSLLGKGFQVLGGDRSAAADFATTAFTALLPSMGGAKNLKEVPGAVAGAAVDTTAAAVGRKGPC